MRSQEMGHDFFLVPQRGDLPETGLWLLRALSRILYADLSIEVLCYFVR